MNKFFKVIVGFLAIFLGVVYVLVKLLFFLYGLLLGLVNLIPIVIGVLIIVWILLGKRDINPKVLKWTFGSIAALLALTFIIMKLIGYAAAFLMWLLGLIPVVLLICFLCWLVLHLHSKGFFNQTMYQRKD